uniref:hypothetical protein n=1 Tax=Cyanothece sp. BG0011 TaxID=2082950 RepID=UPI0030D89EF8
PPVAIAVGVVVVAGVVALTLLETPTTDRKPELLPPPKRPDPRPTPSPSPQRVPAPIPKPEDPNDCEETCKDKYPQYDVLTDYIGNQFPFGGFRFDDLPEAINGIRFNRQYHSKINDGRTVQLGNSAPMDTIFKDREIKFLENLKDPEKIRNALQRFYKKCSTKSKCRLDR